MTAPMRREFMIAASVALPACDDDSKATFLKLCEGGFMFTAEDMESDVVECKESKLYPAPGGSSQIDRMGA